MDTVKFSEFLNRKDGNCLVDLDTCPLHMAMDYRKRNQNISNDRLLCERCDGTGNEVFSMYRACSECGGNGFIEKETPQ